MARVKETVSKQTAILKIASQNKGFTAQEIAAEVKRVYKLDVSVPYVNNTRSRAKGLKGKRRKPKQAGKARGGGQRRLSSAEMVNIPNVLAVRALCQELGGVAPVREALDLLERIQV